MTCDSVLQLIPLYFYGELAPPEEERIEEHLHGCASCTREMTRQRALAAALTESRVEPPGSLLEDCRTDLMVALRGGAPRSIPKAPGPWTLFLQALSHSFEGLGRMRQPVGAVALLAIGFFANNLVNRKALTVTGPSPSDQVFNTVRAVQPDNTGHVQISFDETRRRVLSGPTDDREIQQLLLSAAREDNPAVRVESMDLLKNRSDSGEVRSALLYAIAHDPNPGVRLKAVEGLKPQAGAPDVRKVLAQVLLSDDNSAVRMQVVDLLVEHRDDAIVGVLQDLMQKEDNSYVRLKSEKALKEMNASVGTF
jgi:hypothetical protein